MLRDDHQAVRADDGIDLDPDSIFGGVVAKVRIKTCLIKK